MAKIKKFADVLPTVGDWGENLSPDDVLDKDITVTGYELLDTAWGEAVKIHTTLDGAEQFVLTWSAVLIDQLKRVADDLPLQGQIAKEKRYYTFR